jgi:choline monooxygenase
MPSVASPAELVASFDADAPIEEASMPPSAWYTDPGFYELERRALFSTSWQPLARAAELEAPGCYTSGCFAGEPWVLVRDGEAVRGFHNVCRHKGREVVTGAGVAESLTCGYHGWRYRLDGGLDSAPRIAGIRGFDRAAMSLPPLAVQRWGPWIWASADAGAALSIDAELDRRLAATGWDELRYAGRRSYALACNWKVFVDNYLDGGYHVATAHPSLADQIDTGGYTTELLERCSIQSAPPRPGRPRIGGGALYAFLFPNVMLNRYGPCLDSNWVVPLAPDRCEVVFEFYFEAGVDDGFAAESMAEADRIQREDIALCESVQRGLTSSSYDTGRYAPRLEIAEHHFHRLLAAAFRAASFGPPGSRARR